MNPIDRSTASEYIKWCSAVYNTPKEGDRRSCRNAAPIDITCRTGDNTANSKADDDRNIFQERRAEHLREHDAYEREEAETNELG